MNDADEIEIIDEIGCFLAVTARREEHRQNQEQAGPLLRMLFSIEDQVRESVSIAPSDVESLQLLEMLLRLTVAKMDRMVGNADPSDIERKLEAVELVSHELPGLVAAFAKNLAVDVDPRGYLSEGRKSFWAKLKGAAIVSSSGVSPAGLSPAELALALDTTKETVGKYANLATVQRAKHGEKNFRYPVNDVIKICQSMCDNSVNDAQKLIARRFMDRLRKSI